MRYPDQSLHALLLKIMLCLISYNRIWSCYSHYFKIPSLVWLYFRRKLQWKALISVGAEERGFQLWFDFSLLLINLQSLSKKRYAWNGCLIDNAFSKPICNVYTTYSNGFGLSIMACVTLHWFVNNLSWRGSLLLSVLYWWEISAYFLGQCGTGLQKCPSHTQMDELT